LESREHGLFKVESQDSIFVPSLLRGEDVLPLALQDEVFTGPKASLSLQTGHIKGIFILLREHRKDHKAASG
jgi:hypothetical protein